MIFFLIRKKCYPYIKLQALAQFSTTPTWQATHAYNQEGEVYCSFNLKIKWINFFSFPSEEGIWKGPDVILAKPTVIKMPESTSGVHHT